MSCTLDGIWQVSVLLVQGGEVPLSNVVTELALILLGDRGMGRHWLSSHLAPCGRHNQNKNTIVTIE